MGLSWEKKTKFFPKYAQSMLSFLHPLKNHCRVVVYRLVFTRYTVNSISLPEVPNNIKEI